MFTEYFLESSSNFFVSYWVQSHISFNQVHGEAQGARRRSQEAGRREGAGRHGAAVWPVQPPS